MRILFSIVALALSVSSLLGQQSDQTAPSLEELKAKPIAIGGGKVGELLRQWWKEGTASGNAGDFYDNRDGAHSDLDTNPYPQLQRIVYSPDDIKRRRHWAGQRVIVPHVTFGNSSTSAPPTSGGSNIRMYYTQPKGLAFLYQQYTKNNVYIYPEHRDHDPGHNGRGDGFGDLYPTNTPYLIASQGSSGSDQPFMRAIPFTLAAFRPEVKKKLADAGLLMPALQMIWRSSNKHLKDPSEYLTGKAHPTVFEGSWVDDLQMVRLAHAMEPDALPPMVQLKVIEETAPTPGQDYFDGEGASEKLADTPCVIARIFRGKDRSRRLVVSAEGSYDLAKLPLTFTWVVLRGDPERIAIKPLNPEKSRAEIVVNYHERRPISPGSPLESNRVDIGVFVHNGKYYSAPAFITWCSLDSESRTYDAANRIREIGYGMGETHLNVSNWQSLLEAAAQDSFAGRLLDIPPKDRGRLQLAATEHQKRQARLMEFRDWNQEKVEAFRTISKLVDKAQAEVAKVPADDKARLKTAEVRLNDLREKKKLVEYRMQASQKALAEASKSIDAFLDRRESGQNESLRGLIENRLRRLLQQPTLYNDHLNDFTAALKNAGKFRQDEVAAARKQLVIMGLCGKTQEERLEFQPLLKESAWTAYERSLLERFNGVVLGSLVLPGTVSSSFQTNFVDFRLSVPKTWRDVYRYDAAGNYLGWTRYAPDGITDFSPLGFKILERDKLGRCVKGQGVRYQAGPLSNAVWPPLRQLVSDNTVEFVYRDDQDWTGSVKK